MMVRLEESNSHMPSSPCRENTTQSSQEDGEKKRLRRSKVKPFVKLVNYNHLLPTRFKVTGEFASGGQELKQVVTEDKLGNPESRKKLKQDVQGIFNERYNKPNDKAGDDNDNSGQTAVDFFFKKLKF